MSCTYEGSDWSCHVRITPFGGAGGLIRCLCLINQLGKLRGLMAQPLTATLRVRAAVLISNSNVRVIDDGVTPALEFSRHLFIDPDNHIAGGCVE